MVQSGKDHLTRIIHMTHVQNLNIKKEIPSDLSAFPEIIPLDVIDIVFKPSH